MAVMTRERIRESNKINAKIVSVGETKLRVVTTTRDAIPVKGDCVIVTTPSRKKTLANKKERGSLSDVITHGIVTDIKKHGAESINIEIGAINLVGIRKLRAQLHEGTIVGIRKIGLVHD